MPFDSYTQLRQAEDVQDEIYNISPIDNPFCSMSRTIQATGKVHEWTEDSLNPTKKNAKIEGAAAGTDTSKPVVELQNWCQIMDEVAEITGTIEAVRKYGRDSEMAYQLELRYGDLANDEESAAVGDAGGTVRQTGTPGDNVAVAREMKSFPLQLDASVVVDASANTLISELEASMITAHLNCYQNGGNPGYALTDPLTAGYFADFALSAGRQRDIRNEKTLVNVIDLYVSTYGELDVVLDRNMTTAGNADNAILGVDFNYTATPVLRSTQDWPLAKLGDYDRRQILRESTVAALNTKAHFWVQAVADNLTITP